MTLKDRLRGRAVVMVMAPEVEVVDGIRKKMSILVQEKILKKFLWMKCLT